MGISTAMARTYGKELLKDCIVQVVLEPCHGLAPTTATRRLVRRAENAIAL
jgi:hypothetical protein